MRTTPLVPLASLAHPTGVGGSPSAPRRAARSKWLVPALVILALAILLVLMRVFFL